MVELRAADICLEWCYNSQSHLESSSDVKTQETEEKKVSLV